MSKLSVKLGYDAKVAELQKAVATEARRLQDATEAKDTALREVRELGERKAKLVGVIEKLDREILEKREVLNSLVDRESHFVSTVKQELRKEKTALEEVRGLSAQVAGHLEELNSAAREIDGFIKREGEARLKFLSQKDKLAFIENRYEAVEKTIEQERKALEAEQKDLDAFKTYCADLYGRLASYAVTAKETIEYVNEYLKEKDVPLRFGLPPGEIAEVTFENFNKETPKP